MSGYDWLFTMQLVSNGSHADEALENEPILALSATDVGISEELPSSSEIKPDADENCTLVNLDQPQCRICLDTGGP